MRLRAAPGIVLLLTLWSARADAVDSSAIVVFYAAPDAAGAAAARDELSRAARARGAPLVDLSPAAPPPSGASLHLARAHEAYHDFRYADALAELAAGLAEAEKTGADGLSASELSDFFLYRALILSEQGNGPGAWEEFLHAAAVDPTRKLDPVRFPPRISEEYARAAAAAAGSIAQIVVDAPAACEPRIDGRTIAVGDKVSVPAGDHFLRVTCPGKLPSGQRLVLREGSQTIAPALREPDRPTLDRALAIARRRGAARVVWADLEGAATESSTLLLVAADVATGKETRRRLIALEDGGEPAIDSAMDALLPTLGAADPSQGVARAQPAPRRWYESPWLWGGIGLAVGAAIVLPFALDSGEGGFKVELGGALP